MDTGLSYQGARTRTLQGMGKSAEFARVMLFVGFGVFLTGIAAGFTGLFLQWGDMALIALGPLIVGGLMAFTGVVVTVVAETRRGRSTA
jgi:hypothetical protein